MQVQTQTTTPAEARATDSTNGDPGHMKEVERGNSKKVCSAFQKRVLVWLGVYSVCSIPGWKHAKRRNHVRIYHTESRTTTRKLSQLPLLKRKKTSPCWKGNQLSRLYLYFRDSLEFQSIHMDQGCRCHPFISHHQPPFKNMISLTMYPSSLGKTGMWNRRLPAMFLFRNPTLGGVYTIQMLCLNKAWINFLNGTREPRTPQTIQRCCLSCRMWCWERSLSCGAMGILSISYEKLFGKTCLNSSPGKYRMQSYRHPLSG